MKQVVIFGLLTILLISTVSAQSAIGTVDGYIWNFTPGNPLPGAQVNVTVGGSCTTNCFATYTSEPSGYYVVTNLDFAAGRPITVEAATGNFYGVNTGSSVDSFTPQQINVTACEAPSNPLLIPVADNHSNELFTLSWTSGIDPHNNPTYDILIFDGVSESNAVPPKNKTNLAYGPGGGNRTYSWTVKTCNAQCCSSGSTDSFVVINHLPTPPTLTDVTDGVNTDITFSWSSSTDADGDTITYDFYLDGTIVNNVSSPRQQNVGTGSHTWGVRACDHIACSNFVYDSFTITNNAPSAPTLTPQPNSQDLSRTFEWTAPPTDTDGDPVHSEIQISVDADYSSFVINNNSVSSPFSTTLTSDTIYYWRVRNCDNKGACSAYVEDSFFTFTCPTCPSGGSSGGGGGSSCIERWVCQDWGPCSNGLQRRVCTDARNCARIAKPTEVQSCSVSEALDEGPLEGTLVGVKEVKEYFLAQLNEFNETTERIGLDEIWYFIFNGEKHTVRLLSFEGTTAKLMVTSNPIYLIDLNVGERIKIDLTGDGAADLQITYLKKVGVKADLNFKRLEPTITQKIIAKPIYFARDTLGKWWYVHSLVYFIALLEILLGLVLLSAYRRGRRVDDELIKYIKRGLEKGFTQEQLTKRLLENGWTREEIEWAFKEINNKKKGKNKP